MAVDGVLFAAAYFLAFRLRLDRMEPSYLQTIALTVGPVVFMKIAVYHLMGSYRSIWRYSSLTDLEELFARHVGLHHRRQSGSASCCRRA